MAEREKISPFAKQVWILSGVLINMIAQGMVLSYPSCLLPGLRQPDSTIKIDIHTGSLLASVVALPSIPGLFLAVYLIDRWGRRTGQFLVLLPGILAWLVIYTASSYNMLLIGRIFSGISMNASFVVAAVLIPEYSSPEYRGLFLNSKSTLVALGSMFVHLAGHYVSWRTVALIALIPQMVPGVVVLTWPESPVWLASNKKFEKCKKDFIWLRGKDERSDEELNELIKAHMNSPIGLTNESFSKNISNHLRLYVQMSVLKPMFIILCSSILMEACGRHIFPAYALDIMTEMSESKNQSFYYTMSIDIIVVVSLIVSSCLVKVLNRRTLLFSMGFVGLVVLATFCIYLFLAFKNPWVSVSLLVVYFVCANLACIPLPITFFAELLPTHHRGVFAIIVGIILCLVMQIFVHIMPYLQATIKIHGAFTVLGVMQVAVLLILYFTLPETKDKTLLEIDDCFQKKDQNIDAGEKDEAKITMLMKHDV